MTLRRLQFDPESRLIPAFMAGGELTDEDGRAVGRCVRITAVTSRGVEIEADMYDEPLPAIRGRRWPGNVDGGTIGQGPL